MADVQQAKVAYWRERRDEMQARVEALRTAYAEAHAAGAGDDELKRIRERGEKLAARVENGNRMIAEEEARLVRASGGEE